MSSLLRLERQQKRLLEIHFEFVYNSFVLPVGSLQNHTRFQTKTGKV